MSAVAAGFVSLMILKAPSIVSAGGCDFQK
jgi:hypothetical protein